MDRHLLYAIAANIGLVLAMGGLVLLVVWAIRHERRRKTAIAYAALPYGLRPVASAYFLKTPWLEALPDHKGLIPVHTGSFLQFFAGDRGGRRVYVAEYKYMAHNVVANERVDPVVVVQLPAPLPRLSGPCRFGTWYTYGPYLIIVVYGSRLAFPWIIGVLDEMLTVADQLTTRR